MVSAGPKQKKAETWIDASVKAKTELQAKLKKSGMPIVSTWMKHKAKAEPFVVDLKGVDKLVLVTAGGPMVRITTRLYGRMPFDQSRWYSRMVGRSSL